MQWSDVTRPPTEKLLRQFAGLLLLFLAGFGLYQWLGRGHPLLGKSLVAAGLVLGFAGLIRPPLLRWVWTGWMMAAFPIGFTISTLALALLFFVVFTVMGGVMRLAGRDSLALRPSRGRTSYWEPKDPGGNPARYLRQY